MLFRLLQVGIYFANPTTGTEMPAGVSLVEPLLNPILVFWKVIPNSSMGLMPKITALGNNPLGSVHWEVDVAGDGRTFLCIVVLSIMDL